MTLRPLKKKVESDPDMQQEITALNTCFGALEKLDNYKAELRVVEYLLKRLKGDRKRIYGSED